MPMRHVARYIFALVVGLAGVAVIHQVSKSREPGNIIIASPNEAGTLNDAERRRVIDAVVANLKKYYVAPDVAEKTADALLIHEKRGEYQTITEGTVLADRLTAQMRDMSHDMNLMVTYSEDPLPDRPPGPPPGAMERYREAMKQSHCMFARVEVLLHDVGYFKLNSFPDPAICEAEARAAMARLNNAKAIIFDLRDNGGGYPEMVSLIAAYLFDHPEYMFNPRENTTAQSWTKSPVPGSKLADKPVYVLTSARTFSGAEQFSYDLKMLKRATLVGETTRGGAHAGVFHRIDDHFAMGIPETRPINPYETTGWEGTGVKPDVKVKAADALITAEKMAERDLRRR